MRRGSSVGGPAEPGSFVVLAAPQRGSSACAARSEVASDSGVAANLACFACLRNLNSLLKDLRYGVAAPFPTLARFKFGDGKVETAKVVVDVPVVLAC